MNIVLETIRKIPFGRSFRQLTGQFGRTIIEVRQPPQMKLVERAEVLTAAPFFAIALLAHR